MTHWLEEYIADQSTDRFAVADTLRQLTEVCDFTAETPEAGHDAQNDIARTQVYYRVRKLLWGSPNQHLDTSLLLDPTIQGIAPCPIAKSLPPLNNDQRAYIIGHPQANA